MVPCDAVWRVLLLERAHDSWYLGVVLCGMSFCLKWLIIVKEQPESTARG